jgi:hypothetical protein
MKVSVILIFVSLLLPSLTSGRQNILMHLYLESHRKVSQPCTGAEKCCFLYLNLLKVHFSHQMETKNDICF